MSNRQRVLSRMNGLALAAAMAWPAVSAAPAWAQADSTAAPAPAPRLSWYADGVELREGDIVTVVIDERTSARERFTERGAENRINQAGMTANASGSEVIGSTGWNSRLTADSRQVGEADRYGDLAGTVSARVISIDGAGNASIEGKKTVKVDGREQEILLTGLVRPRDLSSTNVVYSSRLADASIEYQGKKIGPKKGIFGKILGMLWPF